MKEMTCRAFMAQVADWESGRLAPEQSERMADHRGRCGGCAREARAERELRGLWRAAPEAPPAPALWAQIARRLEDSARRGEDSAREDRRPARSAPRWAFAGAAGLAAVCGLWLGTRGPSETPSAPPPVLTAAPQPPAPQASPVRYASWTGLSDVSRVDPAVDDPEGPSVERVWVLINAHRADAR